MSAYQSLQLLGDLSLRGYSPHHCCVFGISVSMTMSLFHYQQCHLLWHSFSAAVLTLITQIILITDFFTQCYHSIACRHTISVNTSTVLRFDSCYYTYFLIRHCYFYSLNSGMLKETKCLRLRPECLKAEHQGQKLDTEAYRTSVQFSCI